MLKKRPLRSSKSIYKSLLLVLLFPVIFFLHQYFLVIRQVICQTNTGSCPAAISATLTEKLGQSLLFFNRQQLIQKINLEYGPDSIELQPSFPGTLTVQLFFSGNEIPVRLINSDYLSGEVINEKSINLLQDFTASNFGVPKKITTEGQVLDSNTNSNLIIITKDVNKETIQKITKNLQVLHQTDISYKNGFIIPPNLILILDTNQVVIFSFLSSIETQILSLQQLERVATIRDSRLIDLRFSRPIVK